MTRHKNVQGYTVTVASCLVYFFICGVSRLSGQLFPACRHRFNVDRKEASLPFTLMITVLPLCGPIVGYLGNKFGLQSVMLFGCLLSSASVGACFFADDIIAFTVLWGVGLGFGFALSSLLISMILHLNFKANFNRMNGLYMASGSLGAFCFPGVADYLLATFGVSGTFLVLSGLMLHSVPAGMLLKVPHTRFQPHDEKESSKHKTSNETNDEGIPFLEQKDCVKKEAELVRSCVHNVKETTEPIDGISSYSIEKTGSISSVPDNKEVGCDQPQNAILKQKATFKTEDGDFTITEHAHNQNIVSNNSSVVSLRTSNNESQHSRNKKIFHFDLSNFRVFCDPPYAILLLSTSGTTLAMMSLYIVMVDAVRDKDVLEDVTILMVFAISDVLGRILLGFLADLKCFTSLYLYAFCSGSSGLLLIAFTFMRDFYSVVVFFALIGALMAGLMSLPNGIIRDYIEKKNLTMAFSSWVFLFGLLNLLQPSIIGYFRETLRSYDGLFYVNGSLCILSAIIVLFIPLAARWRNKNKNSHN